MITAAEIQNKFIYTLRRFSHEEITTLWSWFVERYQSTDEYKFVDLLKRRMGERFVE